MNKESTQEKATDNFRRLIGRYLDQLEYIQNISEEAPFFPQHIHIEPTNSCNLRCIHCIQEAMTRKRGIMPWEVYTKIIDEIAPLGCSITLDVQGEPLLHPQIIDMIEYAKKKNLHVSLLTNGTRLNEDISVRLIDLKLDRIVFSFDAINKELFEIIRKKANFENTLRNILFFIKSNYEEGSPVFICLSIIRQKATENHIDQYKQFFNKMPINTIFVSDLLTMSGGSSVASEIRLPEYRKTDKSEWPICRIGWEDMTVNWDGTVCPCPLDYNIIWSAGNIKDKTLREIWSSEEFKTFRRAHLTRNYTLIEKEGKLCSECNCLWDPEYDLRRYKSFLNEAIVRQAKQFSRSMKEGTPTQIEMAEKYKNVVSVFEATTPNSDHIS